MKVKCCCLHDLYKIENPDQGHALGNFHFHLIQKVKIHIYHFRPNRMAVRGALLRQELSESKFQKYQITHIKGTAFCDRRWRETLAKRHVMGA